jgi:hypothetical protein
MPTLTLIPDDVCENFAVHGTKITYAASYSITGGDIFEGSDAAFTASVKDAGTEAMRPRDVSTSLAVAEIGGKTLTPGTWTSPTINIETGQTVTLDGQGDLDSVFLFQVATTMTTGADCTILLTNGAQAKNVIWAVGTTITTGVGTDFRGSMIVYGEITLGSTTIVHGNVVTRSASTFGVAVRVNGCVIALAAITFGTENHVIFTPQ